MSACAALAAAPGASDPPLRAQVSPRFGPAPSAVRVQAIVAPAAENRGLLIVIDSDDYFRSSTLPLDGDAASRVHVADFRSVPEGVHRITVALLDRQGERRAVVNDAIQLFD